VDKDRHRARCDESARVATARGLCGKDVEVVVVVTGNGSVPHPAIVDRRVVPPSATAVTPSAVLRCPSLRTRLPVPLVQMRVPEQVAAGGVDDGGAVRGLDGQVIQVGVVVDQVAAASASHSPFFCGETHKPAYSHSSGNTLVL